MSLRRSSLLALAVVLALLSTVLVDASAGAGVAATQSVAARKKKHKPAVVLPAGYPRRNYAIPAGTYFSFPNRSAKESKTIRNRVLWTIESVWGVAKYPRTGVPLPGGGTIRLTTWSFEDWAVARALVAAKKRGVSVQVIAAAGKNKHSAPWRYLRKALGARPYPTGHPELADRSSFARICRGSCRGPGGTAHAKYFLFDNVGLAHTRSVVVNTSMNLTDFAYENQWNHATAWHSPAVHSDFLSVFREARATTRGGYHARTVSPGVSDVFFPNPSLNASTDPVMQLLAPVACTGSTASGTTGGRTRIRIVQYAIYGDRGVWIAKRLRQLWNSGCNIRLIYSVASRPVLKILGSRRGPGPIPLRQSVIKNGAGDFVKYNHSKWMTITGHRGRSTAAALTFTGSANWASLAFSSDEQMQTIWSAATAAAYGAAFEKTWRQRTSRRPSGARLAGPDPLLREAPRGDPAFGHGVLRYLDED